ncbi:MAG: glycosyltransferase [Sulfurimonas sp.]|nr:glycosyltransferase [Sulfurimonas sp.]MBU3939043.1 glycosyltransferase [bacterium]MBU4025616.1 glycosyltransferase [bacterium]MBU4059654.1 glycosyltransferase [bacterium]
MQTKPLISIVTVVYNGEEYLEATIQSIINQSYKNIEYIIIDGGSTDGTLDIIKKYEDKIKYWVSEKDRGIYDAMNKGVLVATGEWINFMNAGDIFYNENVLNEVFPEEKILKDFDLIYSNTLLDGKTMLECNIASNVIIHQSLIYRKSLHQEKGLYLVYKNLLISDYLFFMLCKEKRWYKSDVIISIYNTEGLSSEKFSLHLNQKIGTDLIFNNISRTNATIMLLIYPSYRYLKNRLKKIVEFFKIKKDEKS